MQQSFLLKPKTWNDANSCPSKVRRFSLPTRVKRSKHANLHPPSLNCLDNSPKPLHTLQEAGKEMNNGAMQICVLAQSRWPSAAKLTTTCGWGRRYAGAGGQISLGHFKEMQVTLRAVVDSHMSSHETGHDIQLHCWTHVVTVFRSNEPSCIPHEVRDPRLVPCSPLFKASTPHESDKYCSQSDELSCTLTNQASIHQPLTRAS